jgi:nicotinate phosphoribosyltransferase
MGTLPHLYRTISLALLTDLYELTMAAGYFKLGMADHQAVFHLYFRTNPFHGGYAVAAGLGDVVDYLQQLQFDDSDRAYLATLTGNDGKPLLDAAFLDYLKNLAWAIDVDAVPEGTVVFANEPLLRVRGPLLQCQLLEPLLLNLINFQTLIATKAARVCHAARGEPVLEFGMRRAQGVDGALTASRCAYLGGCAATSNVLAGKMFGIPVRGTHAHSWVMSFDTELQAFDRYADALPNNCVFLVDTYNSLDGVRHAAAVGQKLKKSGHQLIGIRLDSGDLAFLSIEARKILDDAGLHDASILASNDLDEHLIESLKSQGATIAVWGVGTRLVTGYDQPALGGVYKLSAIRSDSQQPWQYRIKTSETLAKVSFPGVLAVRRYRQGGLFLADMVYDETIGPGGKRPTIVDPSDPTRRRPVDPATPCQELLVPVFRAGRCVYDLPPLQQSRQHAATQLQMIHPTVRRLVKPHEYPVGLEQELAQLRTTLRLAVRHEQPEPGS